MSKLGFYDGCYIELNDGEIVGPIRRAKGTNNFPWRTIGNPSIGIRCWDDEGRDGAIEFRDKYCKRVLSISEIGGRATLIAATSETPVISQAVVDKGMEAGLKAKPAYEEFVRAILTAALAEHDRRPLAVPPFQITRDAWREAMWRGSYKFDHAADRGQKTIYDYLVDEIQALLERTGYAAKNESVPEKAPSEKTEVQSGLKLYRHKKTGGLYELLGIGNMQTEAWVYPFTQSNQGWLTESCKSADMEEVAIYRAVTDGRLWIRPRAEFEDGRFEEMPAAQDSAKALDSKADMFTICEWDTREGGKLVLVEWPEGYVLRHHGEIVWRSWEQKAVPLEVSPLQFYGVSSDEQLRLIEKIGKNSKYGKLKDGPQTAKQAEEIAEHKSDRISVNGSIERLDPLLRYFLTAIYPGDPLRAVGLDANVVDTEVTRTIEADYGKRGGSHATIRIQIVGPAEINFWKD